MSFRYPAGLITASSPVNANYPSGVWTPRQALPYLQNNVWGQDPFFDQTVLLLHGDGTNGAQNNTFLDSSSNNFTITRNGNTTQGTFTPFSLAAGEWSNYFDGNGDWLSVPSGAFSYTSGNAYTCELWIYPTSYPTQYPNLITVSGSTSNVFSVYIENNGRVAVSRTNVGDVISSASGVIQLNQWNHIAIGKNSSNSARIWVNGISVATGTDANNYTAASNLIASNSAGTQIFAGYISNVRSVTGSDVYGVGNTTITVPTTPLTAITNTSLLTCQSNRFVDNSTNNFAITRNGDVRVTPFSPFQPLLAYSPGVTGGSGYFDGTGDWLTSGTTSALDLTTQDWTVQGWYYPTTYSLTNNVICYIGSAANNKIVVAAIGTAGHLYYLLNGNVVISPSIAAPLNAWSFFALVHSGGTTTLYLNGVSLGTTASVPSSSNKSLQIGADGTGALYIGYISDFRVLKGTANTTVPTAPLTAITNTSLLLNFTNAGIFDNTGKNNLETVDNAQIDTAVKKYGTGSMEFDGTGDYLSIADDPNQTLFGDFTIEGWLYLNTTSGTQTVVARWQASGTQEEYLLWVSSGTLQFYFRPFGAGSPLLASSITLSATTWNHFAIVRNGSSFVMYIDGVSRATATNSSVFTDTTAITTIGSIRPTYAIYDLNGYIDDLRITKGIARYTANFVPPIARFPNQ